jgi:UDP-N-acetylmuramyl pentapeptide phosphotransferase/UDP-N-acetylglucosamine-1-phosphate transferase
LSGLVAATILALSIGDYTDERHRVLIVIVGAVLVSFIGLLDDVLSPGGQWVAVRASLQLVVGLGVSILVPNNSRHWWFVVLASLIFAGYINFVNFMDGINAISSLHGLVVGLTYGFVGIIEGQLWMMMLSWALAAAFIAFLPWNIRRPGIFLGDVGSYLLGGAIAGLGITATAAGVPIIVVLAPISVYIADTGSTLLKRAIQREHIFQAHRTHVYQRLTATWLNRTGSAVVVTASTVMTSAVGILICVGRLPQVPGATIILLLTVSYCAFPKLLDCISIPLISRTNGAPPDNASSQVAGHHEATNLTQDTQS